MIVKLETVGETIDFPDGLGVISFDEFDELSRCAESLLGEGEPGIALYRGERKLKPKDIVLIDSLIELPFDDRRLTGAYTSRMASEIEACEPLATKAHEIRSCIEMLIAELGYSLRTDLIGNTERDITPPRAGHYPAKKILLLHGLRMRYEAESVNCCNRPHRQAKSGRGLGINSKGAP